MRRPASFHIYEARLLGSEEASKYAFKSTRFVAGDVMRGGGICLNPENAISYQMGIGEEDN